MRVSRAYATTLADQAAIEPSARKVDLAGLNWWVPLARPDDEEYVRQYLAKQDFPFRTITQTREVALGGIMLDIGANIGRMAIPRVILGDVEAAYCAEPEPLNYACLVRNVRDNHLCGLVMPDQVAIGSADGSLLLEKRTSGGHRVIDPGTRTRRDTIEVPALTVDSWIARLGLDARAVSFVKVDAQGSEVHVLRGASRLLACRHVAWQLEIDPPLLASRGCTADELFAHVSQAFTHFVDLRRDATGPRVRPVGELRDALAYILDAPDGRTDIIAFSAAAIASGLLQTENRV